MNYFSIFHDAMYAKYQSLQSMEGGMGRVDICKDINTNKLVAVKTIKPEFIDSLDRVKKLIEEAFIWANISGVPNVIMLKAIRFVKGMPQLVLEYGGENTLRDFMQSGTGGLIDRVEIARQITQGLKGIGDVYPNAVHGDLAPTNILVKFSQFEWGGGIHKEMIVNITDFGLSLIADNSTFDKSKNLLGQLL